MLLEKVLVVLLAVRCGCVPTPEADASLRVIRKGEIVFGNLIPAVLVLTFNVGKARREASWQQGVLLDYNLVVTAEKKGSKVRFDRGEEIFVVSGVEKIGKFEEFVNKWNDKKVCVQEDTVGCVQEGLEKADGDGKVVAVKRGDEISGALVPGVGSWVTLTLVDDAKGTPMPIYPDEVLQHRPAMKISYIGYLKVIELMQTKIIPCGNNTIYFCTLGIIPMMDHAVGSPLLCSYVDFRDSGQVCGVYLYSKDKKNHYLRMDIYKNLFTTTTTTPSTTLSPTPTTTISTDISTTTTSSTTLTTASTTLSSATTQKKPQDESMSFRKMGEVRIEEAESNVPTRWSFPVTPSHPLKKAQRKNGAGAVKIWWAMFVIINLLL